MQSLTFKRDQYMKGLKRERLQEIFKQKRVVSQGLLQYQFWLDNYEQNIEGALLFLRLQQPQGQEVKLYLFLLYDCFVLLDENFDGARVLPLIYEAIRAFNESILELLDYEIANRFLGYQDPLVLRIFLKLVSAQTFKLHHLDGQRLVDYIQDMIAFPQQQDVCVSLLTLLSNARTMSEKILRSDQLMQNILKHEQDIAISKLVNNLSKGHMGLVEYFQNNPREIVHLTNLVLKYQIKVALRLLVYDECNQIASIMKLYQLGRHFQSLFYDHKQELETILSYFD